MRCLMCQKEIGTSRSYYDLLFSEDVLCEACRKKWIKGKQFTFHGIEGRAEWLYNDAFSDCLIQMKELGDEALRDVFLQPHLHVLRRRYRGYTLALLPSSASKLEQRGFSHLREIYSCLKLPMIEPFIKLSTEDQKKMNREERRQMMNQIELKEDVRLPKKIVLCDDVLTTGSTMLGALSCLKGRKLDLKIHVCALVTEQREEKESLLRTFLKM